MCKTVWSADLQALPGAAAEPTPGDPSLFVGGNGTRTGLHTDYASSHFWMLVTEGRKEWAIFDAQFAPFLYRGWAEPSFPPDPWALEANLARWPLTAAVRGMRGVAEAGDVVFVPSGSIHAARNLHSPTVPLTMNYSPLLCTPPVHTFCARRLFTGSAHDELRRRHQPARERAGPAGQRARPVT